MAPLRNRVLPKDCVPKWRWLPIQEILYCLMIAPQADFFELGDELRDVDLYLCGCEFYQATEPRLLGQGGWSRRATLSQLYTGRIWGRWVDSSFGLLSPCLPDWVSAQRTSSNLPESPSQISAFSRHGEQANRQTT